MFKNLLLVDENGRPQFLDALSNPLIIVAIISAAFGIACVMLARKVAVVATKNPEVKPNDKTYVGQTI